MFLAARRLRDDHARLKAGEYAFDARVSLQGVIDQMVAGDIVIRRLTIAEGLTVAEVLRRVSEAAGLVGEAPQVPDGRLLPATYPSVWGDSRGRLVGRPRAAMGADRDRVRGQRPA